MMAIAGERAGRAVEPVLLGAVYGFVLFTPLALMAEVVKPGAQGARAVLPDGRGFAAPPLLAVQGSGPGRGAATTRASGLPPVLGLHRQAGMAILVLVLAHVAILMVDT